MTIRFLQPWGGYQIGDRVTLASATETSLKAAGLARDDYTQDGPVSGVPITAIPSAQGNAAANAGDGKYLWPRGKSKRHIVWPEGRGFLQANSGTGRTYRTAAAFRSKPRRVRAWFLSVDSAVCNVQDVKLATTDTLSTTLAPSDPSFWISAGAVAIPAATVAGTMPAGALTEPAIAATAWVDVDPRESTVTPGTYPVAASAFFAAAQANLTRQYNDIRWRETGVGMDSGLYYACRKQDGDKHTDPTTFASTTISSDCSPIFAIEAECDEGCITIMTTGDSISAGVGATQYGRCDFAQAALDLNAAGAKLCLIHNAWGGQGSNTYINRGLAALSTLTPDVWILPACTPNDGTLNAAYFSALKSRIFKALAAARAAGTRVIIRGANPYQFWTWNAANDDLRKAANVWAAGIADEPGVFWAPSVALCGAGDSPETWLAGTTTDLGHPNTGGYTLASVAASTKAVLSKAI